MRGRTEIIGVKKWNFDAPLETNATHWPGVKFENGRVVQIDIQEPNNIVGDITPLCELSELKVLKFKRQKITGIPEEIGHLSQLNNCGLLNQRRVAVCRSLWGNVNY